MKLQEIKANQIEDHKEKNCFNTLNTCQAISKLVCSSILLQQKQSTNLDQYKSKSLALIPKFLRNGLTQTQL